MNITLHVWMNSGRWSKLIIIFNIQISTIKHRIILVHLNKHDDAFLNLLWCKKDDLSNFLSFDLKTKIVYDLLDPIFDCHALITFQKI